MFNRVDSIKQYLWTYLILGFVRVYRMGETFIEEKRKVNHFENRLS